MYAADTAFTTLPFSVEPTAGGIGCSVSLCVFVITSFERYSNMIGYTSIGILTGITYPISYPLFGLYVIYRNNKS